MSAMQGMKPGLCRLARFSIATALLLAGAVATRPAWAQSPAPAALSPERTAALASFSLKPGFRIELVAAEPDVEAPVAMAFDENGRLFVAEMRDYPERDNRNARSGRIRVLEDPNGRGHYSTSRVYAENLAWPSALACYDGGVFVGANSEILFLKDTHNSGSADQRRVIFSGLGNPAATRAGVFLHSFVWGLDNRIHGATGGVGGNPAPAGASSAAVVPLNGGDFVFDPRTLVLEPEGGPARSGLTFDNQGRRFDCGPGHPLELTRFESRYAARNPFFARPPQQVDVVSPATRLFPNWTNPPGLSALSLVDPAGCVIYRGGAFPAEYLSNAFIPDAMARVVHREVLRERDGQVTAARAPEETRSEFLSSIDPLFQPVQAVVGPEGGLYIADLHQGGGKGRIYRIIPAALNPPRVARLREASTRDLVALLAQTEGWYRDSAARLLYERHEASAGPLLAEMLLNSQLPQARLQALHALAGLGLLTEPLLLRGLRDYNAQVRQHAVRLCEGRLDNHSISDALWEALKPLAQDASPAVREQVALTLGEIDRPERVPLLASILVQDWSSLYLRTAVLSSLGQGGSQMFAFLAADRQFRGNPLGLQFLRGLGMMVGISGRLDEVTQTLDFLDRAQLSQFESFALLNAVGEGLQRGRSSLALVDPQGRLKRFFDQAMVNEMSGGVSEPLKVEAIRLVGLSPYAYADVGNWLMMLLGADQSQRVQSAVIEAAGRFNDPLTVSNLLSRWDALSSLSRIQAVDALLAWPANTDSVLAALERNEIGQGSFSPGRINLLRTCPEPRLSARAVRLFGPLPARRPEVVRQFEPALRLKGISTHGRELFQSRCAQCHRFEEPGTAFGPDLTAERLTGRERILDAILEPHREVNPDFLTYVLFTRDGRQLAGLVRDENPEGLTFCQPGAVPAVWPKANIQVIAPQSWSLMPAGLEHDLSTQDLADLLDYLMGAPAP